MLFSGEAGSEIANTIGKWVGERGGGNVFPGSFTALGWVEDGEIKGGITYSDYNGAHCICGIALEGRRFPLPLLNAGLYYPFKQLALRRLTFPVAESNIRSIELVSRLGATREATLRAADPSGNMLIFALFPEDCRIWKRLDERLRKRPAGS